MYSPRFLQFRQAILCHFLCHQNIAFEQLICEISHFIVFVFLSKRKLLMFSLLFWSSKHCYFYMTKFMLALSRSILWNISFQSFSFSFKKEITNGLMMKTEQIASDIAKNTGNTSLNKIIEATPACPLLLLCNVSARWRWGWWCIRILMLETKWATNPWLDFTYIFRSYQVWLYTVLLQLSHHAY